MTRFLQTLLSRCRELVSTRREEPGALPVRGAPRKLLLETGTFPVMRGVRYTVARGVITCVSNGERTHEWRRQPAPEEWRSFWTAVNSLRVGDWRSVYPSPRYGGGYMLDGRGWRFRMRDGKIRVHSSGSGGYPAVGSPQLATGSSEALEILRAELSRLVRGAPPIQEMMPEESEQTTTVVR